jgi:hypothetical protein
MYSYRENFRNTTGDAFARAAVYTAFRPRDAKALDQSNFVDRPPNEAPRPLPESWRREIDGPKHVELTDLIGMEAS